MSLQALRVVKEEITKRLHKFQDVSVQVDGQTLNTIFQGLCADITARISDECIDQPEPNESPDEEVHNRDLDDEQQRAVEALFEASPKELSEAATKQVEPTLCDNCRTHSATKKYVISYQGRQTYYTPTSLCHGCAELIERQGAVMWVPLSTKVEPTIVSAGEHLRGGV